MTEPPENAVTRELGGHYRLFLDYARSYDSGNPQEDRYLRLKEEHSLRVLETARRIADEEGDFSEPDARRALLLAALYHDLARFPQYARFKTFSDPRSFNHGLMAGRELGRLGFLDGEAPGVARPARAAVVLHNRPALPDGAAGLPGAFRTVAGALRDADKLDILRVMEEALRPGTAPDPTILLHVADSPEFTPAILGAVRAGRMALYSDMRSTTDFRILLCAWFYDLNYPASRRLAARGGHYHAIIRSLPDHPDLNAFAEKFHAELALAGA